MKRLFVKKSGEVANLAELQDWLANRIKLLRNGKYILKIEYHSKKRTLSQNKLMWLWFACIAQETGGNKDDIYLVYTHLFLKKDIEFQQQIIQTTERTSKLDTFRFAKFLDEVQIHAQTELGITLPDPDDLRFAEFEAYYSRFL